MTPVARRVGVVVMAYGSPASLDDVPAYYTHIRRGRPPTDEQIEDLLARYRAIGGTSPLAERTRAQVARIAAALEARDPGRFVVELGQKHAAPFIEDAVGALAAAGVGHVVGLVLTPHYSAASVGQYHERAAATAGSHGLGFSGIDSWHLEPAFVEHQARALRERLDRMPASTRTLFTAHSLPERVLVDDPYVDQLRASAEAIATRAGLPLWYGWGLAWQSAGRTPEPWRGPDVLEVIRDLADTGRSEGVLVVPQGFTSDHLEVRYDLDVEAAGVAAEVGLTFGRAEVVNDDPAVMGALAARVAAVADEAGAGAPR